MVDRSRLRSCLVVLALVGAGCSSPRSKNNTLTGEVMGTTFTVYYRDERARDLSDPVDSLLEAVDGSLSLSDPSSAISSFNAAKDSGAASSDAHLIEVIRLAQAVWLQTSGALDPTMLPFVEAWGLGGAGHDALDTTHLEELREFTGLQGLRIEDGGPSLRITKLRDGVRIEPNGIARGYTVDLLASLLDQRGIGSYMVQLGGAVRSRGTREDGTPWTIVIERPGDGSQHDTLTTIEVRDRSLATTSNEGVGEVGVKRYGHLIDPRSGRPLRNGLLGVSVFHERSAIADALSTALLVMGPAEAKAWLERQQLVPALLVIDDHNGGYRTWATPGWPGQAGSKGWEEGDASARAREDAKRTREKLRIPSALQQPNDSATIEEKQKEIPRERQKIERMQRQGTGKPSTGR